MRKWWTEDAGRLAELERQLHAHAPRLRLIVTEDALIATGVYELRQGGVVIDRYSVFLAFEDSPDLPPKVWETGGRIPKIEDRHIGKMDGACCIEVWGERFARTGDASLDGFLAVPFRNYFLGQTHFERRGTWPFDERSHGLPGMVEAYAELLKVEPKLEIVGKALELAAIPIWKGHWRCPCGGAALRTCCGPRLAEARSALTARSIPMLLDNLRALVKRTGGELALISYAK